MLPSLQPVLAGDTSWSTLLWGKPPAKCTDRSSCSRCTRCGEGEVWPEGLSAHFPKGAMVRTTLKVIRICISCNLSVRPTAHMLDLSAVQLLQSLQRTCLTLLFATGVVYL